MSWCVNWKKDVREASVFEEGKGVCQGEVGLIVDKNSGWSKRMMCVEDGCVEKNSEKKRMGG